MRVESVTRVSVAGSTHEFRTTGIGDYAKDRREDREDSSGCRTISIGEVPYNELPSKGGFPTGKHWVQIGGEDTDSEALFEQSQQQSTDAEGGTVHMIFFSSAEPTPTDYLDSLRGSAGAQGRRHRQVAGCRSGYVRRLGHDDRVLRLRPRNRHPATVPR